MKTLPIAMLAFFMSIATTAVYGHAATAEQHKHDEAASEEIYKEKSAHMQKMQEHMKKMDAEMQAIHAEKDLDKRKELMQAHRKSIREGMEMMMQDDGDEGTMGRKKEEIHEAMKGEDKINAHAHQGNTEEHLDLMVQMMEQMMQHQNEAYELFEAYRELDRDLGS